MVFELTAKDPNSRARAGVLTLPHGRIETPIFMPVGTLGTVKTVLQRDLKEEVRAQIILGNTYHLYLRPGTEILEKAGGLHKFMDWDQPILTDSGGYQVYSLSQRRKITEEGVEFNSHIDGSKHQFTPERAIDIQRSIGGDVIMAFDECPPYPCDYKYAKNSMELTHRWLKRCFDYFGEGRGPYGYDQVLAPILQGSVYEELRRASAEFISPYGKGILAIGGLSVGETEEEMYAMAEVVTEVLPEDQARYLMGVGTPANLLECIERGVDMFDCVLPTRNARHGILYTWEGIVHIKNAKWKDCLDPLDHMSRSLVSQNYSRAYLRHLFQSGEYLAAQIASIHNLAFYLELVEKARNHIIEGTFSVWKVELIKKLRQKL
jgi:queuine tRNA-ribosyltransferase